MFGIGSLLSGLNLPAGVAAAIRSASQADQRQAFTTALLATVSHVNNKPNFNLELEINDLWTRLNNLRSIPAAGATLAPLNTLTGELFHGQIQKALEEMGKSLGKVGR